MLAGFFRGRQVFATALVALLGVYSLPCVEAVAQAVEGRNGEFYFCHRAFPGPRNQGERYYFSRILPNPKPAQQLDEAIGKAFVRHVLNLDPAIPREHVLEEEFNWGSACWSSWPYGTGSFTATRSQWLAIGGKEVDWEYAPDKDLTVTPLPPAPKAKKPT
jgi:hypothetical protein